MKQFPYTGKDLRAVLIRQIIGILCLIVTSPLYIIFLFSAFFIPASDPNFPWIPFWFVGLFLFSFSIGSFYLNYFPTIWTDAEGLYLSFCFVFRIKILWSQVIDIRERNWFFDKAMLVRVRKFLPFHILYGLFYSGKPQPEFLFMRSVQNGNDLIAEIHMQSAKNMREK